MVGRFHAGSPLSIAHFALGHNAELARNTSRFRRFAALLVPACGDPSTACPMVPNCSVRMGFVPREVRPDAPAAGATGRAGEAACELGCRAALGRAWVRA